VGQETRAYEPLESIAAGAQWLSQKQSASGKPRFIAVRPVGRLLWTITKASMIIKLQQTTVAQDETMSLSSYASGQSKQPIKMESSLWYGISVQIKMLQPTRFFLLWPEKQAFLNKRSGFYYKLFIEAIKKNSSWNKTCHYHTHKTSIRPRPRSVGIEFYFGWQNNSKKFKINRISNWRYNWKQNTLRLEVKKITLKIVFCHLWIVWKTLLQ
jgi:hypothetical protein